MTTIIKEIPLSKLVPSSANVRRTGREANIDELAASIAAHGLLQNLTVRPVLDGGGNETSKFEVVAGGRRLAALKLLAKHKGIAKTAPIPCQILEAGSAEEVSLAENITQCPMHPSDQYETFARLATEQGLAAEDIAARFGVTPVVVKQRMKLGAVSPALMQVYREGGMTLDQLMGFTLTDDHMRQEHVWAELGWNKSRDMIRRMLTEGHVSAQDRRVRFVGVEAYETAGGAVLRDLFDEEDGGYLTDPALLDRLVNERLEREADTVRAEGWLWIVVVPEFDYRVASGMRRLYPQPVALTEDEQVKLDALVADYDALSAEHDGEVSDEIVVRFEQLEAEIDALKGREQYDLETIARCGVFVSLGYDGGVRIERGFLRPENERVADAEAASEDGDDAESVSHDVDDDAGSNGDPSEPDDTAPISDRLVAELSAYRTAGLRDALADHADVVLNALVHALAAQSFYQGYECGTCLDIAAKSAALATHAPGIDESAAARRIAARHESWAKRLPREVRDLWPFVLALSPDDRLALLAHCVSLTVDALVVKWDRRPGGAAHADALAQALALDMTASWTPTAASYFGRVSKARILDAVREAVSEDAAMRIAAMKKQPMADAAEQLLAATGWLPVMLRTPGVSTEADVVAGPSAVAAE